MRYLNIFLSIYIFISCSNNTQPEDNLEIGPQYATILVPLSDDSINVLQSEFDNLNKNRICTRLNRFGYIGNNYCDSPSAGYFVSEEDALHQTKEALVLNSKFTSVFNSTDLIVERTTQYGNNWRINFENQVYKGYEIIRSNITVWFTGNGVFRISGFWFKNVNIPSVDIITPEIAKESIIGEQITYYGWGDDPFIYTITEESIADSIEKAVFPYDVNDTIELRVVWKIGIDSHSWDVLVDTSSGEIVKIIQNFII